jgi:hypothetical protein
MWVEKWVESELKISRTVSWKWVEKWVEHELKLIELVELIN